LLPVTYDTKREVSIAEEHDEAARRVELNDPDGTNPKTNQPEVLAIDSGKHSITVSAGRNYDSLRDEATETANTLLTPELIMAGLQDPKGTAAKIVSLLIGLKDLGPIGDKIADVFSPPDEDNPVPPQIQAAMQQQQQQLQQAITLVGQLQKELKEKTGIEQMKVDADILMNARDNETRLEIEQLRVGASNMQTELELRLKAVEQSWARLHESELAPDPGEGSLGLHPDQPPTPEEMGNVPRETGVV